MDNIHRGAIGIAKETVIQLCIRTLAEALCEGNSEPIVANSEELASITMELHQTRESINQRHQIEAPIYGYVWLSLKLAQLLCIALHRPMP